MRLGKDGDAVMSMKLFGEFTTRAQLTAAIYHRHGRTNFREQQGVFRRCISAANHADVLARELIAIALAGFDDAATCEFSFTGNP